MGIYSLRVPIFFFTPCYTVMIFQIHQMLKSLNHYIHHFPPWKLFFTGNFINSNRPENEGDIKNVAKGYFIFNQPHGDLAFDDCTKSPGPSGIVVEMILVLILLWNWQSERKGEHWHYAVWIHARTWHEIFLVRQLQEKYLGTKKLYFAFVDLEKAFHRVHKM